MTANAFAVVNNNKDELFHLANVLGYVNWGMGDMLERQWRVFATSGKPTSLSQAYGGMTYIQ